MTQLWTETFFPKTFDEFIGNSEIVENVIKWADSWNAGKPQMPMLLFGQSGAGKTSLAHLVAMVNDWELFELNASDSRSKEMIERLAGGAAMNASFSGKKRLVLLDEVDGLQSQDRGGAGAIVSILKETKNPIILTANDIYSDKKLAPLRSVCNVFEFKKINYLSMAKRLREILEQQNFSFEEDAVKELAKKSNGDFRSALLDLQTLFMHGDVSMQAVSNFGDRLRMEKVFNVLGKVFRSTDLAEIKRAVFASDVSNDLLLRWIEENIPRQLSTSDVPAAFEVFSRADRFNGRIIRRQSYEFLRYSGDLMSSVGIMRQNQNHSFVPFVFPTLLSKLSRSSSLRELKGELAQKIAQKTHSSKKDVLSNYLPFLRMGFENREKAVEFTAQFGFDEKEVAFLIGSDPKTKKVSTIIADAAALHSKELGVKVLPSRQSELKKSKAKAQQETQSDESAPVKQTRLF